MPDGAWRDLLFHARSERIVAPLARAVRDGLVPATDAQAAEIMDLDMRAMAGVLALEAALLRVADVLGEYGLPFRVLKGPAVAHLDYPDPALREFGDLDLLIRPADLDRAIGLLSRYGFTRRFPEPRPGFDRRFTKSVSVADPGGVELDLHRTFASGGFGLRVHVDALWDAPAAWFEVGGRELPALGPDERFLHACYHAVLGNSPPRLVPLRDVAELLVRRAPNPDRVRDLAASWRGEAVVAHAVRAAWATLRLTARAELSDWAAGFAPLPAEYRELRRATSPTYSYPVQALDTARAVRGPRNRLAYLSALAFPRRSYLRGRHPGFVSRTRHAIAELSSTVRHQGEPMPTADRATSVRHAEMSASRGPAAGATLAVLGGDSQFPDGLPLTRVVVPDRERLNRRLEAILDSGMLTSGPNVAELEERVADALGVAHVVAVASCTTGLMLVLQALDATGPVLMPSFTFAATAHAAAWAGGTPAFADADARSLTLDPDDAAARLAGARALMATHVYGTPCDVERIDKIAADAGVPVVYDAAHALGSKRRGKAVGGFGTAEVFSLSPTKVAPAGEGGLVATHDGGLAEQIRLARNYGNPGDYDCRVAGLNARMSEFHAAV
ncbi:MAG: DegT/DnrJ/EryC1/StrS family aminotransferase, partial [bacterium]